MNTMKTTTMKLQTRSVRITAIVSALLLLLGVLLQQCRLVMGQPGIGHRFLANDIGCNATQYDDPTTTVMIHPAANHDSSPSDDNSSVPPSEFFGVFTKLGTSWNTILKMFRTIVNTAGGIDYKDDVYADTMEEALAVLKSLAPLEWNFHDIGVPLNEFKQSSDDVYRTFLKWAVADGADDNSQRCKLKGGVNGKQKRINISKAYRRLERYVTWMQDVRDYVIEPPLTASSLQDVWGTFSMKVTYDDCQRLVWWLDLGGSDLEKIRYELPPKEITRIFVWISHFMMFDKNAQTKGIVLCHSLANVGFWTFMTMLPLELGISIDEFVVSVIPLKTKFVLLLQRPPWAKFAYQLLKPFIVRNMRRRVVVIEDGLYSHSFVYEVLGLGSHSIPAGVDDNYAGSSEADIVGRYFEPKESSSS
jgi:CRAL/TRIO domain